MVDDNQEHRPPAPRTADFEAGGKLARFIPRNFEEARWVAAAFARAGDMVPQVYRGNPEACLLAIMAGSELDLTPHKSLQYIAPINGRATVWGDALPALLQAQKDQQGRPLFELDEWYVVDGVRLEPLDPLPDAYESIAAFCSVTRRGSKPVVRSFTKAQAERAGLWQTEAFVERRSRDGKTYKAKNDSPWFRYPERMLKMRARSYAVRDAAADVLAGLAVREEMEDVPAQAHRGPDNARDVTPEANSLKSRVARTAAAERPDDGTPPGGGEKPAEVEADDAELVDDEAPQHVPGDQLDLLDNEAEEDDDGDEDSQDGSR